MVYAYALTQEESDNEKISHRKPPSLLSQSFQTDVSPRSW